MTRLIHMYNSYQQNKNNYKELQLLKIGGNKTETEIIDFPWDQIKVIQEIGKGHFGLTLEIDANGKTYALKRQKITEEEFADNQSTTLPINRELDFFKWIDSLSLEDQIFFMKMYGSMRYLCDFEFVPIRGTLPDELISSKYCQDIVVDKKDHTIENLINDLAKNEIISIFCQTTYAINLMHDDGYYHFDTKLDNICYTETKDKMISLGNNGEIKSYGRILSLIDYGQVLNQRFQMNENEKFMYNTARICNVDLFLLVEYVMMRNVLIYQQIDKQRINIKPVEIYEIIKSMDPIVYKKIIKYIWKKMKIMYVKDFDTMIKNHVTFEQCKKNPQFRESLYEVMQIYQISYPREYYESIGKYFKKQFVVNELKFTEKELLFIKKNSQDLGKILRKFIKYIR